MNEYAIEKIIPLKGADRVRKRPAVIFGSSDVDGALMAVANIIDNASNEAKAGYGKSITVRRFEDNSYEVIDQGRGIPVEYDAEEDMYSWQLNFCELYAGSKFSDENFHLKFNGLGLCSVQYASEYMDAIIYRKDKKYTLHFEKGENIGGLKVEKNTKKIKGTYLKFKLDDTVFEDTHIKYESMKNLVKDCAVSNLGVKYDFEYIEANRIERKTFLYQNLADRIRDCFPDEELMTFEKQCDFKGMQKEHPCYGSVDVCIAYTKNKRVEEVYHHGRFLKNGGIALQELKRILSEKVKSLHTPTNMELSKENEENILNNISIVIQTTIYPKTMVRWVNGTRSAIDNPIIGETIRTLCPSLVEELLDANREDIRIMVDEVVE